MFLNENGGVDEEKSNGCKVKTLAPIHIKTSQSVLASDEEKGRFSRTVPSSTSHAFRERVTRVFSRKIDWGSVWNMTKEWIKNPMNMVLLVWMLCVVVSGAILFLVMTGMLNSALPRKSQRDAWFEVNNQILNALFTLICLYHHPHRLYHLVLLLRWRSEDISKLRKLYCKNGTSKPHEWAHILVVILLLNLNCFAQYALCGLNVGYNRSKRPAIGVAITISVAIAAPAVAGVYTIISPLGKDYNMPSDEESQHEKSRPTQQKLKSSERKLSFVSRDEAGTNESSPKWSGGVLDFWEDISLAYLSLFCSFCVFGWNMERLGFGNMYVHIATFILFCSAPFWIFTLAAININNETAREALGTAGLFLCVFGLLYGGFWRIQMRKRFNLPPSDFCCGKPAVTDCALWLCCCWCSLAQEVRTGNAYDIVEDYKKPQDESCEMPISPLPREGEEFGFKSGPSSPLRDGSSRPYTSKSNSPSPSRFSKEYQTQIRQLSVVEGATLEPPISSFIRRDDHQEFKLCRHPL